MCLGGVRSDVHCSVLKRIRLGRGIGAGLSLGKKSVACLSLGGGVGLRRGFRLSLSQRRSSFRGVGKVVDNRFINA